MFTEQEFREAFRAQVDDEVADVVGVSAPATAPVVPLRRRPRWPVLVGAAAGVVVLAGAAIAGAQLWDPDPAPASTSTPAAAPASTGQRGRRRSGTTGAAAGAETPTTSATSSATWARNASRNSCSVNITPSSSGSVRPRTAGAAPCAR